MIVQRITYLFFLGIFLPFLLSACQEKPHEHFATPTPYPAGVSTTQQTYLVEPAKKISIKMPEDEAEHPSILEWWYYTGQIETVDGAQYAVLFILFKTQLGKFPSSYTAHLAIAPLFVASYKGQQPGFTLEERVFTRPLSVRSTLNAGFTFQIKTPSSYIQNNGFLIPKKLKASQTPWILRGYAGNDYIEAQLNDASYAIRFFLKDEAGITLPTNGLLHYVNRDFPYLKYPSYYYQRPYMGVSGIFYDHGQPKKIRTGYLWFDHQWFDTIQTMLGWRWFALILEDHSMILSYRYASLSNAGSQVHYQFGFYVPPCQSTHCQPNQFRTDTIPITQTPESIHYWTSPKTHITYPVNWTFKMKAENGSPAFDLKIDRYFPNAEIDSQKILGTTYWEGPVRVSGIKDGKPIKGVGFAETFSPQKLEKESP